MTSTPVIDVDRLQPHLRWLPRRERPDLPGGKGEVYALLGTNGAGKTFTLETVEGHRSADSGTVRVFGRSPRDRRAVRSRMGIMLQEGGFSPDLTVKESVGLIGTLSRRTDTVERVLDIVDLKDLGKRVRDQPGHRRRQEDQKTQAPDHGHARSRAGRPHHCRERARHHRRQAPARRCGREPPQCVQGLGRRRIPEQHLQSWRWCSGLEPKGSSRCRNAG